MKKQASPCSWNENNVRSQMVPFSSRMFNFSPLFIIFRKILKTVILKDGLGEQYKFAFIISWSCIGRNYVLCLNKGFGNGGYKFQGLSVNDLDILKDKQLKEFHDVGGGVMVFYSVANNYRILRRNHTFKLQ